jgi:hypothetical protein
MKRTQLVIMLIAAAVVVFGCSKRVTVEIPPRVDLHSFDVIGIVDFDSDAKGTLPSFATQRFIESIQRSQPGVYVLELGNAEELKEALGRDKLDFAAMQAIREQYGVEAVILGDLEVSDMRPNLDLGNLISAMSLSAEVDAALSSRMFETRRGATVWTSSTRRTDTVAHVGTNGKGSVRFDAKDPERAYGALVDALVHDLTRDFRVTYVKR